VFGSPTLKAAPGHRVKRAVPTTPVDQHQHQAPGSRRPGRKPLTREHPVCAGDGATTARPCRRCRTTGMRPTCLPWTAITRARSAGISPGDT
jgi:hypothetical protein